MQGDTVQVSRGPAAGMIAIKHLGTNGRVAGSGLTRRIPWRIPIILPICWRSIAQTLIPVAMIFAMGFYINRRKFANVTFAVA